MRPEDLVSIAEILAAMDEQGEAAWRVATHTAYYAVYHLAAQHFRLDTTKPGAEHGTVGDLLRAVRPDSRPPRHIVVARRVFTEMKRLRVLADYHLDRPFSADEADRALQHAQSVVAAMPR